eukprot:TsM_000531400 transcript=TsM_000531400 gene=TsM_000531400
MGSAQDDTGKGDSTHRDNFIRLVHSLCCHQIVQVAPIEGPHQAIHEGYLQWMVGQTIRHLQQVTICGYKVLYFLCTPEKWETKRGRRWNLCAKFIIRKQNEYLKGYE